MPAIVHEFAWPDRFVVGTIGRPGSRTFYLQVRDRAQLVTVALEKEQSALLAVKIDEFLDELRSAEGNPFNIPDATPTELVDNDPLEQPVDARFRTGAMSLGWDPTTAQLVIEAYAMSEVDDTEVDDFGDEPDAEEPTEILQVQIPVGAARAFAKRTLEVVGAGRPLCALCGTPVDPEGHVCPMPGDL
jgi:uncharacterized repeat protein (TIGR03847 family)